MENKKYKINNELSGIRLDKAIALQETDLSRVAIQRLLDEGNILVNEKKAKSAYKTQVGDEITIFKEKPKEIKLEAQEIPLNIIYEDDDILVVNKQKGLVVHPGNGNPNGTLVNAVMAY